jgi:hypothetical protein
VQFKLDKNLSVTRSYHQAKIEVERWVERFARNLDVYKRVEYNPGAGRVRCLLL